MSEQDEIVELDPINEPTEEVEKTEEVEETTTEVETEDKKPEFSEAEKKAHARAKKAEAEVKELKAKLKAKEAAEAKPAEKQVGITPIDTIALMTAKVTEQEDIEFVTEYAQFKNISIADALKSSVVKGEMAERLEKRATAEATNTGTARRGSSKPTHEQILANAEKGKLPEDAEDLAEARLKSKYKS